MSTLSSKHLIFTFSIVLLSGSLRAGDGFPAWDNPNLFKQDLRRATLATNLPNITEADHFLGAELSGAQIYSNAGDYQHIPAGRLSIYPNPDYNLWVQFARWPGSAPNFSVGTGIQVAFQGDDLSRRQAIGVSWNTIFDEGYVQRDIALHGLYGTKWKKMDIGIVAMYDIHHVLVENGNGIPDYDASIFLAMPFIARVIGDSFRLIMKIPYNTTGPGLVLRGEILIRKRK